MASGQTLINRALRLIGATAAGETPSSEETADALTALNAMIETWRNDRLMTYAMVDSSLTMVIGTSSYTVGTSGNLNITRPVKFESAYIRQSDIDYDVRLIDFEEWNAIPDKTTTGDLVEVAYYNPTIASSQGTLQVWPKPSAANVLHLVHWTVLTAITSLSDAIVLPPGYEQAMATNLAIHLSPEYPSAKVSPILRQMAVESLASIKQINAPRMKADSGLCALLGNGSGYNIFSDT